MTLDKESVNVQAVMAFLENMDPWDFEYLCAQSLLPCGFDRAEVTPGSNDYGVDILAQRGQEIWAIQCKRWKSNRYVDTSAVEQVFQGAHHYGCTHAAVLTTTLFTDLTRLYAQQRGVHCWDRYQLYYIVHAALHDYGF